MEEKPITKEYTNEELLLLYRKTNDKQYLDKLYNQISDLIYYICKNYGKQLAQYSNLSLEELVSIANVGVAKIIQSYSFEKNVKFSTAVFKYITQEFRIEYRYYNKRKKEVYLDSITINASARHDEDNLISMTEQLPDESIDLEESVINTISLTEDILKLKKAINELPEQSKTIIIESFFHNKNNEEIGKKINIIANSVSRSKMKTLNVLKEMITDPDYDKKQEEKKKLKYYGSVKDIPENYQDYLYLLTAKEKKILLLRIEQKKTLKEIATEINSKSSSIGSLLQSISNKIKQAAIGTKTKVKPSIFYAKLYNDYKNYIPKLKEMDQLVLNSKYKEHKKYAEISKEINKSIPIVCSIVRNAEIRFKNLLIKQGKIEDTN